MLVAVRRGTATGKQFDSIVWQVMTWLLMAAAEDGPSDLVVFCAFWISGLSVTNNIY